MNLSLLDKSWWHVSFHDLVLCGLYSVFPHLETRRKKFYDTSAAMTRKKDLQVEREVNA